MILPNVWKCNSRQKKQDIVSDNETSLTEITLLIGVVNETFPENNNTETIFLYHAAVKSTSFIRNIVLMVEHIKMK